MTATAREAARQGAVEITPLLLGIIPFGLVVGVSAIDAGLGTAGAVGLSMAVFAGASQLAAIELLGAGAPAALIVVTMLVINLRFAMYSAALAPLVVEDPRWRRGVMAYLVVDQPFALTVSRVARDAETNVFAYWVGCAVPLWVTWQVSTLVGAALGATLPEWLPLEAVVPLMFLVILVPTITDRPTVVAAVSSGVVAVLAAGLPANSGLLVAAATGIVAGTVVAERTAAREPTA